MKERTFFNWPSILLGMVAIIGFCFTQALAEMDGPMTSIESENDFMVEEPGPDLENLDEPLDEAFGQHMQYTWIPIDDFTPWRNSDTYTAYSDYYRYFLDGTYNYLGSGINLPNGAYLYGARAYYYDNHSSGHIETFVWRKTMPTGRSLLRSAVSSGTPGYSSMWLLLNHTIRNGDGHYVIYLGVSTASVNLRVGGVRLYWNRQVSPAPSAATFNDVGTSHWAFRHIEALAASGITTGCGGDNFCPDQSVTRAQMAVFLSRALGLHWGPPY